MPLVCFVGFHINVIHFLHFRFHSCVWNNCFSISHFYFIVIIFHYLTLCVFVRLSSTPTVAWTGTVPYLKNGSALPASAIALDSFDFIAVNADGSRRAATASQMVSVQNVNDATGITLNLPASMKGGGIKVSELFQASELEIKWFVTVLLCLYVLFK